MAKKTNKYAGPELDSYDPTGISEYIGLGRPIDFSDNVTRLAILCAILGAAAAMALKTLQGAASDAAAMSALAAALGFIFSFMVALELDPDRKVGGVIGGLLTVGAYLFFGEGNILVMLWMLFILRMLTRTSGDRHRIGDNVLMIVCGAWLGAQGYWLIPVITGIAYILESQITKGYYRSLYLAALAFASVYFADRNAIPNNLSMAYIYLIGAAFIIFLPELRVATYVKALGDKNGKRLLPKRLQTAQGFYMMMLFSVAFMHGNAGVLSVMPAIMAGLGCGIYLIIALVRHKVVF